MDQSFEIYRNMAILNSNGRTIADILKFLNVSSVCLYGIGEIGEMVYQQIAGKVNVSCLVDKNRTEFSGRKVKNIESIPKDDSIIVITVSYGCNQIRDYLKNMGVDEARIITINVLLKYGIFFFVSTKNDSLNYEKGKEFLIYGAAFDNLGSQSMLYVTINQICKKEKNAVIWVSPCYFEGIHKNLYKYYKFIPLIDGIAENATIFDVLPRIDAMIDISGYALSNNQPVDATERNITYYKMALENSIPLYIMPQSFGPLDYKKEKKSELGKYLRMAKVVYARESQSLELIRTVFPKTNVVLSDDLVLQNREVSAKNIYTPNVCEIYGKVKIDTANNVGIVPNMQIYRYGKRGKALYFYHEIINKLIRMNKNIYIIKHSSDEDICEDIYAPFCAIEQVRMINDSFDCLEFMNFVKEFDFLIASRFHSIVHAYKMGVPCIVLGWANKYYELMEKFNQLKYFFDIYDDLSSMDEKVEQLEKNFLCEKASITLKLEDIQRFNCFDFVFANEGINDDV